jgi:transcriptional regulator with XRE-family HTH domain
MEPDAQIGQQLSLARTSAGVSQIAMARRMGVSRWWIRRTERGERSVTIADMMRYASALGATVRVVVTYGEEGS